MSEPLAAVVMAGGLGTRMRSTVPKHLHPLLGRRMVDWVLEAARPLEPAPLVVVASPDSRDAFGDMRVAVQEQPLGTGDAVRAAPDPREAEGVNTRAELAAAAAVLRDRINHEHMLAGVTIVDPGSTWIEPSVSIEPDVVVYPFTVLRGRTTVAGDAQIGPHAV